MILSIVLDRGGNWVSAAAALRPEFGAHVSGVQVDKDNYYEEEEEVEDEEDADDEQHPADFGH